MTASRSHLLPTILAKQLMELVARKVGSYMKQGRFAVDGRQTHGYNGRMSPTGFSHDGYHFFFFSREEARPHVHVVSSEGEAKFWLKPEIRLASSYHYSRKQLRGITKIIEEHEIELIRAWQKHFGT